MKTTTKLLFGAALMLTASVGAQVPSIINYQGRVSVGGVNFNGVGQFKFALVSSAQTFWKNDGFTSANEPASAVAATVTKGLYSVGLGDTTQANMAALPASVFTNADVRLRVWFSDGSGFQQLSPDQRIYAVGYALNAANVSDGAITSAKIATGAIQQSHLAAGVGGGSTVNDGDITTAKIADAAVTATKISSGSVTGGHLNLSGLATTLWQVGGNAGTAAGTHFLGTTDNQALEFRINNSRALRINPGASAGAANFIVGGTLNGTDANVRGGSIVGGEGNAIADGANFALIGGGQSSVISTNAALSVIGGGISNLITSSVAFLGGGFNNVVSGFESAVVAGEGNVVSGGGSFIGGGVTNTVTGGDAVIVGGGLNVASGLYSFVGAGVFNGATNVGSLVVGGSSNVVWSVDGSITGGSSNFLHTNATVAVISGGYLNVASNYGAAVVAGSGNVAGGFESFIGGGEANVATGTISTIGGGYFNGATGYGSAIPGGFANFASGTNSWAGGTYAAATNHGTFVWSDNSSATAFGSTTDNEFSVRASGGVRFASNAGGTTGVSLVAGGGSWAMLSDRNAKENFAPIDAGEVLEKVAKLPVTTWNYHAQADSIRHIGPMAQDFKAAFGLGQSDRTITSSDLDGVALAAIKGLNEKLESRDQRIADLEQRLKQLEALLLKQAE